MVPPNVELIIKRAIDAALAAGDISFKEYRKVRDWLDVNR